MAHSTQSRAATVNGLSSCRPIRISHEPKRSVGCATAMDSMASICARSGFLSLMVPDSEDSMGCDAIYRGCRLSVPHSLGLEARRLTLLALPLAT